MIFDMDNSLGFVLNKTALLSKANFNCRLKAYGISPEQWSLLFRVVEKSGLTQKELSDSTYKDQANITRSIDRLIQKGLMKRVPNEQDRRSFNLFPTEEAAVLVGKVIPISKAHNEHLTESLTSKETEMLKALLKKVYQNLEKETE
ncbi:MarR family winged helix-turn-helix transcriptional regulator [Desulfocastanea catecholica]